MKQKPLKIFYNGEPLRDSKGKFTSVMRIVWRGCEYVLCAVGILIFIGAYNGSKQEPLVYEAQAQEVKIIDKTPEKIEELKDDVVTKLQKCESGGHAEDAGVIIFDTNNKASIGSLQFQRSTVQHYYKVLYNKVITGQEAVEIAINPTTAKELAKKIIFEDSKGVENWHNCATKLGLYKEVEIIKKLAR